MQLSFTEAEGRISWEAKMAKKKKKYVERYSSSSSNNSGRRPLMPPSKRFKVEDELLKPSRDISKMLAAYPTQRNRHRKANFSKHITIPNQKAMIWEQCRILKKMESELRVLEEIQKKEVEEDEKRRQERCAVLWKPLSVLREISHADVVVLEKTIFDEIMNDKHMQRKYLGSLKDEFKIAQRGSPLEIRFDCSSMKPDLDSDISLEKMFYDYLMKDKLDFSIETNELWKSYGDRGRELRWHFSYDGKKGENEIHMFTVHFKFLKWVRNQEEDSDE